ncbi:unnamed protein product [Larinioides sclopetarius]|uniref:Uncharacterized protein n=1 Tax=Larinioides sclopetarius TaxID=280406 RepID=A0AAV1ZB59_9ARAC
MCSDTTESSDKDTKSVTTNAFHDQIYENNPEKNAEKSTKSDKGKESSKYESQEKVTIQTKNTLLDVNENQDGVNTESVMNIIKEEEKKEKRSEVKSDEEDAESKEEKSPQVEKRIASNDAESQIQPTVDDEKQVFSSTRDISENSCATKPELEASKQNQDGVNKESVMAISERQRKRKRKGRKKENISKREEKKLTGSEVKSDDEDTVNKEEKGDGVEITTPTNDVTSESQIQLTVADAVQVDSSDQDVSKYIYGTKPKLDVTEQVQNEVNKECLMEIIQEEKNEMKEASDKELMTVTTLSLAFQDENNDYKPDKNVEEPTESGKGKQSAKDLNNENVTIETRKNVKDSGKDLNHGNATIEAITNDDERQLPTSNQKVIGEKHTVEETEHVIRNVVKESLDKEPKSVAPVTHVSQHHKNENIPRNYVESTNLTEGNVSTTDTNQEIETSISGDTEIDKKLPSTNKEKNGETDQDLKTEDVKGSDLKETSDKEPEIVSAVKCIKQNHTKYNRPENSVHDHTKSDEGKESDKNLNKEKEPINSKNTEVERKLPPYHRNVIGETEAGARTENLMERDVKESSDKEKKSVLTLSHPFQDQNIDNTPEKNIEVSTKSGKQKETAKSSNQEKMTTETRHIDDKKPLPPSDQKVIGENDAGVKTGDVIPSGMKKCSDREPVSFTQTAHVSKSGKLPFTNDTLKEENENGKSNYPFKEFNPTKEKTTKNMFYIKEEEKKEKRSEVKSDEEDAESKEEKSPQVEKRIASNDAESQIQPTVDDEKQVFSSTRDISENSCATKPELEASKQNQDGVNKESVMAISERQRKRKRKGRKKENISKREEKKLTGSEVKSDDEDTVNKEEKGDGVEITTPTNDVTSESQIQLTVADAVQVDSSDQDVSKYIYGTKPKLDVTEQVQNEVNKECLMEIIQEEKNEMKEASDKEHKTVKTLSHAFQDENNDYKPEKNVEEPTESGKGQESAKDLNIENVTIETRKNVKDSAKDLNHGNATIEAITNDDERQLPTSNQKVIGEKHTVEETEHVIRNVVKESLDKEPKSVTPVTHVSQHHKNENIPRNYVESTNLTEGNVSTTDTNQEIETSISGNTEIDKKLPSTNKEKNGEIDQDLKTEDVKGSDLKETSDKEPEIVSAVKCIKQNHAKYNRPENSVHDPTKSDEGKESDKNLNKEKEPINSKNTEVERKLPPYHRNVIGETEAGARTENLMERDVKESSDKEKKSVMTLSHPFQDQNIDNTPEKNIEVSTKSGKQKETAKSSNQEKMTTETRHIDDKKPLPPSDQKVIGENDAGVKTGDVIPSGMKKCSDREPVSFTQTAHVSKSGKLPFTNDTLKEENENGKSNYPFKEFNPTKEKTTKNMFYIFVASFVGIVFVCLISIVLFSFKCKNDNVSSIINEEKRFYPNSVKFEENFKFFKPELGSRTTKEDARFSPTLKADNSPVDVHLKGNFNFNNLTSYENICRVDNSTPESSEEYSLHGNKPSADEALENILNFTFPNQTAKGFVQEEIQKSFAEMRQLKTEIVLNHTEEKDKTSILPRGAADAYSNRNDKIYSLGKFSESKESPEETRKPSPVSEIDEFKTKNILFKNVFSHSKQKIYHYTYLDVVPEEILFCIICAYFMTSLFIFALYKCMSRSRTLISSNTNINESLASSSELEIQLNFEEPERNSVATTENVSKTEDRAKVNKENILWKKKVDPRLKTQNIPENNLKPRFVQEKDEVIGEEQEEREFTEFHSGKSDLFHDYLREAQTDGFPEIYSQKKDTQNRKFRKDNCRKKVKCQQREDIIPSKNLAEMHAQSDESCSQIIKGRSRKFELRTKPTGGVVNLPSRLAPSANEEMSGGRIPNSSQLHVRNAIFLQQGDLRFQYISETNSNFTIDFKTEEKVRTQDRTKHLKYKLKVKKEPVRESTT